MKTRNGFVSNSSSSSFVIFGYEVQNIEKFEEGIFVVGYSLGDGQDIFPLTKNIFDFIITDQINSNELGYIKGVGFDSDDWSGSKEISKHQLPDTFKIFSLNKDYHCTADEETFIRRYCE